MTTSAVQTFCALLAGLVFAFTLVLVALRVVLRDGGPRAPGGRLVAEVGRIAPGLAAAIAVGSMAGSLYFSEVAHYVPCTLCWYQRIAMYPLAIVLTIAAIRRDPRIRLYAIVLAGLGLGVSTYHWFLERFPSLETGACSAVIPCDFVWFEKFGFVTLPFMAGCGFLAVLALVTMQPPSPPEE
jgi:Disulfide bond formation protein DsbB